MGEGALPVLPELLRAVVAADPNVSQRSAHAIHKIGPKAVAKVREAFQAATDEGTRERLAAALWGLGDEGRGALKESLKGLEAADTESLWWAAFSGTWDGRVANQYQLAIREALKRAGQTVPPPRPRLGAQAPADISASQHPSLAWSVKLLADGEAPGMLRQQASSALLGTAPDELVPFLPALLKGFVTEQDPTRNHKYAIAGVIRSVGPPAITAVKTAIGQATTDITRRDLLQLLSALGKEGHDEFTQLMRLNPEYGRLFRINSKATTARDDSKQTSMVVVRFLVHVPKSTPKSDLLCVAGNDPALEKWNPKGLPLERQDSGDYEAQVHLSRGSHVEYKITRGSWETVEKGPNKEELANRVLDVTTDCTIPIHVTNWNDQ